MLDKRYDPKLVEEGKYEFWKENNYFTAGVDTSKPAFSMVLPPPNVTGKLHVGHALQTTIQDIIARYKRLQGYDVLFLPGTDHAGIATQAKVEERLRKQGINKYDIGREKFLDAAWNWKKEYAENIHSQWAKMGFSLDYSRERFTLDDGFSHAVNYVFKYLYEKGLIYQGERIINWDPDLQTALSNIEVIHKDDKGSFYYFKYNIVGSNDYLEVATTRPETMFGDVCVVVNPKDKRFTKYVGKEVINPANGDKLPIIADNYVDIEFGTGAMKCTPAHDPNDYNIGKKYGFPMPKCMNENGTMNSLAGKYNGMDRFECRKALIEDIKNNGNFIKEEEIIHSVGHSERSDAVVEPYLSKQWFVKVRPLADKVLELQRSDKKIKFYPDRFNDTLIQWMENADDWCISRQLWWGHRIPVYYHKTTKELLVSEYPPKDIENWDQDPDVLDTWFSSALWPFGTMGWPEQTPDYKRYYPTSLMGTAYDIIFFWVARMVFSGLEYTKEPPFKEVLINGLIRDPLGRKMSKSLGNGVDPLQIIDKYGADAMRYYLTTGSTPGQDIRFQEDKIQAAVTYLNKIWNSARFILSSLPEGFVEDEIKVNELSEADKFILSKLEKTIDNVTTNMNKYEFTMASNYLYNFVYDDFCSWYLELSKVTLQDESKSHTTLLVLLKVLKSIIKMIYPFTPFIAEELYQALPNSKKSIMEETYPVVDSSLIFDKEEQLFNDLILSISEVRNFKVREKLAPNAPVSLKVKMKNQSFEAVKPYLSRFTFAESVKEVNSFSTDEHVNSTLSLDLAIEVKIDKQEVLNKINQDIEKMSKEVERCEKMLTNPNFISKAPQNKIDEEKAKLANYKTLLEDLLKRKSKI